MSEDDNSASKRTSVEVIGRHGRRLKPLKRAGETQGAPRSNLSVYALAPPEFVRYSTENG